MKKIEGYPDYEVTEDGRVYSHKSNRWLKQNKNSNGYPSVSLSINGRTKTIGLHRLVAEAYLPNTENKPCVNHIDGNKCNNNIKNLEWCTYKENYNHALDTGLRTQPPPPKSPIPVAQLDLKNNVINVYPSIIEASRQTGLCESTIRKSLLKKENIGGGFKWKKIEMIK